MESGEWRVESGKNKTGNPLSVFVFVLVLSTFHFPLSSLLPPAHAAGRDEELFFLGAKAFEDGFNNIASEKLDQLVRWYSHSPRVTEARLLLGRIALRQARFNKALDELEKVWEKLAPNDFVPEALYWSGEVLTKAKDYTRARIFYQRVLDEYPRSNMVRYTLYGLGICEQLDGKWDQSKQIFENFLNLFPSGELRIDVQLGLAESLRQLKKYREAYDILQTVLSSIELGVSHRNRTLYILSKVRYDEKDYASVMSLVEPMIASYTSDPWIQAALYPLAWSYLNVGQYQDSLDTFNRFTERAAKDPLIEGAILGTGLALAKLDNHPEAIARFSLLIEKYPEGEWMDEALFWKADSLYHLERFRSSIDMYQQLLREVPKNLLVGEARYNLAWAYVRNQMIPEAIHAFQEVADTSTDEVLCVSSLCRIGDLYLDQNEFKQAAEFYDVVLKEYAESPYADYAQYQLGSALSKMGDSEGARLAFQSLISHFTESRYREQSQFQLGLLSVRLGRYDQARREFQELIRQFPESSLKQEAQFHTGTAFLNEKKYESAMEVFQNIRKEYPNNPITPKVSYQIGGCFYQMGKEKKALDEFGDFLERYPQNELAPDVQFWFGEYYYNQAKYELARNHFSRLREQFPRHALADDALYWIAWISHAEKKVDAALQVFEQLKFDYPKSELVPEADFRIAELKMENGRTESAIEQYKSTALRYRNHPFGKLANMKLGYYFANQRNWREAIFYFKNAQGLSNPHLNAEAQFELARSYQELGNRNQAAEEFLNLTYRYPEAEKWVLKSWLEAGKSFEEQGRLDEAKISYSKLAEMQGESADWARSRVEWIDKNLQGGKHD